jgi:TfoX/Sxy family transcriptional regulator of competence genes
MFGNLGAFVNGNMFMGLFGPEVGLKLPEAEAHQVVASGGGPFGPAERPMTGYVSLPAGIAGRPGQMACRPVARIRGYAPGQKAQEPKKAPPGSTR